MQSLHLLRGHWRGFNRPRKGFGILALGFVSLAFCVGCDATDPNGRVAVEGEILVDGRPLKAGAIALEPLSDGTTTSVGARIRSGSFTIPRNKGPAPGVYRVRIYASSGVQAPPPKGASERVPRPMIERIPDDYNTRSNRTVAIEPGRTARLRFEIATKGGGRPDAASP